MLDTNQVSQLMLALSIPVFFLGEIQLKRCKTFHKLNARVTEVNIFCEIIVSFSAFLGQTSMNLETMAKFM
jgi:hypothetical protein